MPIPLFGRSLATGGIMDSIHDIQGAYGQFQEGQQRSMAMDKAKEENAAMKRRLDATSDESRQYREGLKAVGVANVPDTLSAHQGTQQYGELSTLNKMVMEQGLKDKSASLLAGLANRPKTLLPIEEAQIQSGINKNNAEAWKARHGDPEGKQPPKDQFDAAGFAKSMEQAEDSFGQLSKLGYDQTGILDRITGSSHFPDVAKSEGRLLQEQAQRNFINAKLRRDSGAAISDSEFSNAQAQYFPSPGDTQQVLAQKTANRAQAIAAMQAGAGRAYDRVRGIQAPQIALNAPTSGGVVNQAVAGGSSKAGSIVRVNGKRFKVGADGDSLEPIK